MQSLLLCLTTVVCLVLTTGWSQYCNGIAPEVVRISVDSAKMWKQDQSLEPDRIGFVDEHRTESLSRSAYASESSQQGFYTEEARPSQPTIIRSLQIKPLDSDNNRTFSLEPISAMLTAHRAAAGSPNTAPEFKVTKAVGDSKSRAKGAALEPIEASLPEISRLTILHHFKSDENPEWKNLSLDEFSQRFIVKNEFKKDVGLFITLIKNGDTRACWGSINSTKKDLVRATVYTTVDALNKDYRYSRVRKSEINQLIPQVTVIKRIVAINSMSTVVPLKQGLMVRAGGKGAVLLPGEASDPHYQLVKTKLKAGIPMSQPCQLYKIEADVYR